MPPFCSAFRTFLSLWFVSVALAGCDDCPGAAPCGPRVIVRLNLAPVASDGATVTACHVDDCVTVELPAPAPLNLEAPLLFRRTDVHGSLVTRKDASLQLVVNWDVGSDGDRYALVVRDAAGVELASLDEVAIFPRPSSRSCNFCGGATLGDPP